MQDETECRANERQIGQVNASDDRIRRTIEIEGQQNPSRFQDTLHLGNRSRNVRHVAESVPGRDEVECLVAEGLSLRRAVQSAIVQALSDDPDVVRALGELVDAVLPRP